MNNSTVKIQEEVMTPLVHLPDISESLYAKIEYQNPLAAMKYRAIPPFFDHLLRIGEIQPGDKVAIRSAGSAAVAMAWKSVQIGLHPIAVLPSSAPAPIIRMLRWLGTEVHILPPAGATEKMRSLADSNVYVFAQAGEKRLIDYYKVVGDEIYRQLPEVNAVTVGIGTGLSIMGIYEALEKIAPGCHVYGCEPNEAPVASGGTWAPHQIAGLAPPIPQPLLDTERLSGILTVKSDQAWNQAALLARKQGLLIGPSSGCTIDAALQLINQGERGPVVAVLACGMTEYLDD